jgi:structural maintenance of chromosome 2
LGELVYKSGQARVVKATVTIVFDNSDKSASPLGYEQYNEITVTRQIVIGGKNKYLINGKTQQVNTVATLFHSVGLNVNNPHFLIMQGRITKVVNMKPAELLSLLEEAAGTRMYETKKKAAQKTMAKKDAKNLEIDKVINEEIQPQLDKYVLPSHSLALLLSCSLALLFLCSYPFFFLGRVCVPFCARLRKDRSTFLAFTSNVAEIERLKRFCIAYSVWSAQQIKESSGGDIKVCC